MVAYDSGNGGVRAWRLEVDELEPLWHRKDIRHAGHLILYPDTRELVVGDWNGPELMRRKLVRPLSRAMGPALARSSLARRASLRRGGDELVVLDLDSGVEKARVAIPSPIQGFLFPSPGFDRDLYYQSLTTIARVRIV